MKPFLTLFIALLKLIFQADQSSVPLRKMMWFTRTEKKTLHANKYFIFVGTCAFILITASCLLFRFSDESKIIMGKENQLRTDSLNTMKTIEAMKNTWHKDSLSYSYKIDSLSLNYIYKIDSLKCVINPKNCPPRGK